MDSHTTGLLIQDPVGAVLSTELPTEYHHYSIIEWSICWCVWKAGKGFPSRFLLKILKLVVVYSSVTFDINVSIAQQQVGPASVHCDGVGLSWPLSAA